MMNLIFLIISIQNCERYPPPWLIAMQRYGPPPSYPNLKIPGLNASIPEVSKAFIWCVTNLTVVNILIDNKAILLISSYMKWNNCKEIWLKCDSNLQPLGYNTSPVQCSTIWAVQPTMGPIPVNQYFLICLYCIPCKWGKNYKLFSFLLD